MKKLEELTEEQFNKLKKSGMLLEIYPEAPEFYFNEIPKPKEKPNFESLIKLTQGYLEKVSKAEANEDYEHYIFEEVMSCIYGREIWNFINEER